MIMSIVLSCIIHVKAHELVVPDSDGLKHGDEHGIMQLLQLFSKSHGIANELPDKAFSATDVHGSAHPAKCLPITNKCYWAGKKGGTNAVTVDMTTTSLVTGVATKGITDNEYVTNYRVATSENGNRWTSHGHFVGNFDGTTVCKVRFDKPILARFVKFTVLESQHNPSMWLDVLVYDIDG